jgi:hypothetical protein
MKYIKTFDTESNYAAYRDGTDYLKPNVSLCDDKRKVHYNYPKWDTADKPFVDFGLPSGTLWATCNVGASTPTDNGFYFQWGDTVGYTADQVGTDKQFSWTDCKWRLSGDSFDNIAFTKYNKTDNKTVLELEDDAANVNMGGNWHIPTPAQIYELEDNTIRKWTTLDGVSGITFTSKNDNSKFIFFPAAGSVSDGSVQYNGSRCYVWSSMIDKDSISIGRDLFFSSEGGNLYYSSRCDGLSVRGVIG